MVYTQLVAFFFDATPEITSMTFVLVNRLIDMLSCDRLQVVELHSSHPIETAGKTLPQLCCHATKDLFTCCMGTISGSLQQYSTVTINT